MTAQEALAIALDEAVIVMDAMPRRPTEGAGVGKLSNAAAMPGATNQMSGSSSQKDQTLSEHMAQYHKNGFNPKEDKCKFFDEIKDSFLKQGLSEAEAERQALLKHGGGVPQTASPQAAGGEGQNNATNEQPNALTVAQPPKTPEAQEAEARKIAEQGPEATIQKLSNETSADLLSEPRQIEMGETTITAETVGQLAGAIVVATEKAKGKPQGEEAATQLVEALSEAGGQNEIQSGAQTTEEETILSTDGKFKGTLSERAKEIIRKDPSKREIVQMIADKKAAIAGMEDSAEKKDAENDLRILSRLFYGGGDATQETQEGNTETNANKFKTPPAAGDGSGDKGGENPPNSQPPPASGSPSEGNSKDLPPPPTPPAPPETPSPSGPVPPPDSGDKGANPEENERAEDTDERRSFLNPVPDDDEFRVGKNKYKLDGRIYTDVSGKGLFRTGLAAFMAGLRGEQIITGWDRINGTWDAMKRSEKGEMVRDGIASALCKNTIAGYANKEGLSDDAQMEISVINDMMNQADTPQAQMKAIKQFQKWKETYAKELGELEKPISGETFQPLPNAYKGKKPPVSILKKSEGFKADKEFGDKVATGLQERLDILGFQIDELVGVSVGPSATTVKFKIPPTFDMTAANSKKTREALKGAIGTAVSSVEYAKGEKDVMAITVTNPEMRNVSFADIITSDSWKQFSKKASLPIALGRDSSGKETMLDAATMPQTIVTGATGSGKSVFISSAINSIEMEKTPDEARIVLLDPKNEFKVQDGSPHLLFPRAGGDPDKAKASKDMADVLDSLVAVMNERVTKIGGVIDGFDPTKNEFKGAAEHSIKQYNEAHPDEKMPHILLVFDEIANARDNASAADKERIDLALQKITAIGRSVGVNALLCTQRDDVGSIPGIIQANCPGRVTFKASPTDAKASPEAKALAGNGDYILTDKGGNKTRGRGCFISQEEEMAIPSYYRDHMEGGTDEMESKIEEEPVNKAEAAEGDGELHKAESKGEPSKTEPKKSKEEPLKLNMASREAALESAKSIREDSMKKADEEFAETGNLEKYERAINKAEENYRKHMHLIDVRHPEQIQEGDALLDEEPQSPMNVSPEKGEELEETDELALFDSPRTQVETAKKELKKKIVQWRKDIQSGTVTKEQAIELHNEALKRLKKAEQALQGGEDGTKVTGEQMYSILNPTENKAEVKEEPPATGEAATPETADDTGSDAEEDEEKLNEARRNSVPPQKGYSEKTIAGSYEATERLTPKEQATLKDKFMPPGWEFVTQNKFKSPAINKFGVIFVRDPKTGSAGRIIRDEKNPKAFKFQIDVDTTDPDYKGFVKKADGTWELSPEAKKVEQETAADRHSSKDEEKRWAALRKFNRARYGHDEAPNNSDIVAQVVADIIKNEKEK